MPTRFELRYWERADLLGVPVYLHPRDPLPGSQGIYEGHPELFDAVWTFTVETSTHALRLMTSGLLDRYQMLTIIIGHMGEAAISDKIGRSNAEELFRLKQPVAVKLKGPSGSA